MSRSPLQGCLSVRTAVQILSEEVVLAGLVPATHAAEHAAAPSAGAGAPSGRRGRGGGRSPARSPAPRGRLAGLSRPPAAGRRLRHPRAVRGSAWMTGTRPVRTRERGSALWRSPCKAAEVYRCDPFRGSSWPGLSRPPTPPRHAGFAPPPASMLVGSAWITGTSPVRTRERGSASTGRSRALRTAARNRRIVGSDRFETVVLGQTSGERVVGST